MKNKRIVLKGLLCLFFVGKIFLDLFVVVDQKDNKREFHVVLGKQQSDLIAYDDAEIARSALFFLQGKGFVIDSYFDRPQFAPQAMHKTALRPKALIMAHVFGLQVYEMMTSLDLRTADQVPARYLAVYAWFICLLKNCFLAIALWYFYKVCTLYFSREQSLLCTLFFLIYPSVYFFVGYTNMLDTLVMPLEVIFFCFLLYKYKSAEAFSVLSILEVSVLLLVLCYLKPHHLLLLFLLDGVLLFYFLREKKKREIQLLVGLNGVVLIGFIPILLSNYKDFHEVFISTQSGFNLFHGHNLVARGSWSPMIWENYHDQLFPMLEANSQLQVLNEKQESDFYGQLAWQWAIHHPWAELELIARKIGIYFLPHNFMNWKWSLYNLVVYVGCALYSIRFLFHFKQEDKVLLLFFVPILGIFMVNILYFVEYRWRYYAEPFMLFFAFLFICQRAGRLVKKYV